MKIVREESAEVISVNKVVADVRIAPVDGEKEALRDTITLYANYTNRLSLTDEDLIKYLDSHDIVQLDSNACVPRSSLLRVENIRVVPCKAEYHVSTTTLTNGLIFQTKDVRKDYNFVKEVEPLALEA